MSALFDAPILQLTRGMDIALGRQNLINSNIANLETPGFVPHDVDFASALEAALAAPQGSATELETTLSPDKAASANGNLVDLDIQMGRLSQNSIFYGAQTRAVSRKLAMLKYAAGEGA